MLRLYIIKISLKATHTTLSRDPSSLQHVFVDVLDTSSSSVLSSFTSFASPTRN